jgi:hypothetical protein
MALKQVEVAASSQWDESNGRKQTTLTAQPSWSAAECIPSKFDYIFPELASDPQQLLPEDFTTIQNLLALGTTMKEAGTDPQLDSAIPSAYTYFGQFVDHDLSLEVVTKRMPLDDPSVTPLCFPRRINNSRRPILDLEPIYANYCDGVNCYSIPRDPTNSGRIAIGRTSQSDPPVPGKSENNDLVREGFIFKSSRDRAAKIGDSRNDQNLMISQMHVAFLRAHNRIVDEGCSFEEASKILRQHYQHIILNDYLPRIVDPDTLKCARANYQKIYHPAHGDTFMPFEFSVAAFRFGHSMIRRSYFYNVNFDTSDLERLLTPNALGNYFTLPASWIIQWENFVDGGTNRARRIDTHLVAPLFALPNPNAPGANALNLAQSDLLRGYLLRLPTGQAVANRLGLPVMSANEIEAAVTDIQQADLLRASGFSSRTPLWFYILAEAAHHGKDFLGPVGGTIVASVLTGLVAHSPDSIMETPGWVPSLSNTKAFDLSALLKFAGVL